MNDEETNYWILYFLILFLFSGFIHHFYKKIPQTMTSDGSIIMAIGIFTLDALQKMPSTTSSLVQLITLELLIIWLYLVNSYRKQYQDGYFQRTIQNKINQFGIGTWVAGTSVLAILLLQTVPSLHGFVWTSFLLTWIIWLVYMVSSSCNLWLIIFKKHKIYTGIILLPTVSTQSIVLFTYSLFATAIPLWLYQTLIIIGYLFYLIGFFIFVIYRHRYFILRWNNTNSIIHGALSISGLAGITTHALNDAAIISTWFLATVFLVLNEGISVIKGIYRLKKIGFLQGIFVYDGSQWARVFTFGMYYAFNRALLACHIDTNLFVEYIVRYGQYGVLLILLFELFNYFAHQLDFERIHKR